MKVRNFEKFEKDHWYIYTGTKRESDWNRNGHMDYVLDHTPRKCTHNGAIHAASFKENDKMAWSWETGFDNWIEVEEPVKQHFLSEEQWIYDISNNKIIQNFIPSAIMGITQFKLTRPPFDFKQEKEEEPKCEFKVGDKVRIVDDSFKHGISTNTWGKWLGKTVTINYITMEYSIKGKIYCFKALEDIDAYQWPCSCAELVTEKPKFKVGDKVRIVKKIERDAGWMPSMDQYLNSIATITIIEGNSFCIIPSVYWFPFECAELVEAEKEETDLHQSEFLKKLGVSGVSIGGISSIPDQFIFHKTKKEETKEIFTVPKRKKITLQIKRKKQTLTPKVVDRVVLNTQKNNWGSVDSAQDIMDSIVSGASLIKNKVGKSYSTPSSKALINYMEEYLKEFVKNKK